MPKQRFVCAHCEIEFYDYASNRKGHTHYYCSKACKAAREAVAHAGPNSPRWKGNQVTAPCEYCGTLFVMKAHHYHRFARHFCSRKCKSLAIGAERSGENNNKWQGGPLQLVCDECGVQFERARRSVRANSKQYFCSRKCKGDWTSKHLVGPHAARWAGGKAEYYGPNWLHQSRAARKRDKYRCRICGNNKGQRGKALDVHHIKPFKSFGYIPGQNDHHLLANDLTNLLTLCPKCHKAAEAGEASLQPYLL